MNKTPKLQYTEKKLNIERLEASLIRHPSVKSLFDDKGNPKTPSNDSNNKNDIYKFNIKNNEEKDDEELRPRTKSEANVFIKIDKVEHKIVDNKESFFVDSGKTNNIISNSTKVINQRPAMYKFSNEQKELDDIVTKDMSEGKEYGVIEKKFLSLLKNKK